MHVIIGEAGKIEMIMATFEDRQDEFFFSYSFFKVLCVETAVSDRN